MWLNYLVAGLPAHGWEPVAGLVAGKWHDVGRYRGVYPRLPVLVIENRTGSAEGRVRALVRAVESVNPDVVVGVNIVDLYPGARRLRAKGAHSRTVMALHGIAADLLGDLKREADTLDGVIATNRLACRLCVEHSGIPSERVFYAPYGVDVRAFGTLPRPSTTEVLRIAWVGRLDQDQKRADSIPEILAGLDSMGVGFVLRIAGDGPDREPLLRTLEPWIQAGRVEYLGSISPHEVGHRAYARTDVLLVTSMWETGPIVIWEAMAAGIAVVSSRYIGSGLEGALKHGENCLLFGIGDAAGATEQLARLRDATLREALVRAGQRLVAERYSIGQSVSAWAECLDRIMELPTSRGNVPPMPQKPAGRLDWTLGVSLGESVRSALGIRFNHTNPGGEWPHTAAWGVDERALLEKAGGMDTLA